MPAAKKNSSKLDKDYFHEIAEKCAYLGVVVSEKDFLAHPDTYQSLAASYDKKAHQFNLQHKDKLLKLQQEIIQNENLSEAFAFGKAGQLLRSDFHKSLLAKNMAQVSFDIIQHNFNFSINELANPSYMKRLVKLAENIGVDASILRQTLTDGENVAAALFNSTYKNDLIKIALLDENIQFSAANMASFANEDCHSLLSEAALHLTAKTQFSRLITQNINQSAFSSDKNVNDSSLSAPSSMEQILQEFSKYRDNQNGKLLLTQNAKALKKKANFVYLDKIIKTLHLDKNAAVQFRIQLSQYKGSVQDFLQEYSKVNQLSHQVQMADHHQSSLSIELDHQPQTETVKIDKDTQKKLIKKQQEEQNRLKKRAQKEADRQRKIEQKKQQRLAINARKEAVKKQKAERKLQRKLARKAKREVFFAKLKSLLKKTSKKLTSVPAHIALYSQQYIEKMRNLLVVPKRHPHMRIYVPKQKRMRFLDKIFSKLRHRKRQQIVRNISINIESYKEQKKQAKKAKIIKFKENVRKKSKKTLKYAAIGVPFVGLSYLGYKGAQNMGPAFDFRRVSMAWDSLSLPKDVLDKANIYYADANDFLENQIQDYQDVNPSLSWTDYSNEPDNPINEADYDVQIPLIKNDKLHNVPNADFFNLCFEKTNSTYLKNAKYGITKEMYNNFMRENRALANFYNVGSFQKLSMDDARIIAKAQVFDKYGISHIQNKSMAAYLYYTLLKNHDKNCSVAMVASAISDFYELKGMQLSSSQQNALDNISKSAYVNPNDWRELIAAINLTTTDQDTESMLFATIQQSQFRASIPFSDLHKTDAFSQQVAVNADFAFEPTFDIPSQPISDDDLLFADNPFLADVQKSLQDEMIEPEILNAQKEKDLEIFCKIYAQCSYDNVIRLSYGDKRKAFADANKALAKNGILGKIDQRLYCAGMSVASLCQAYEIFKQENPNSFVADAVGDIISKCRRHAHSTTGMRDVFKKHSKHVTLSTNLEKDIKAHMQNHPYSILQSGFRRNSAGNQHYNGFFPSMNTSSKDAYTYCAYNNNHWGNEKTFSSVLRDRRRARYGKGGWYVDVTAWIEDLADVKIKQELKKREIEREKIEQDSLPSVSEQYFNQIANFINQKIAGR